jgi:uncharacterized membrane protein (UPF0127 family)
MLGMVSMLNQKHSFHKKLIILGGLVGICLLGTFYFLQIISPNSNLSFNNLPKRQAQLYIGQTEINVTVVDVAPEREEVFKNKTGLDEGEGILLAFQRQGVLPFPLKDIPFEMDLLWLDVDYRVVGMEEALEKKSYPQNFVLNQNALYILVVEKDFVLKHNVKIGDEVKIFSQSVK